MGKEFLIHENANVIEFSSRRKSIKGMTYNRLSEEGDDKQIQQAAAHMLITPAELLSTDNPESNIRKLLPDSA